MLVRSVRTSHECNFQDMWKRKSARPTTSRKAGYAPESDPRSKIDSRRPTVRLFSL